MGKIKQGILGGFKGKVGTVIGSSWNGIAYMKGQAQSVRNPKTAAQMTQRNFFKEVQELAAQISNEQLAFLFPNSPKNMTRRNMLAQQLAADPIITDNEKHVNLSSLTTIGNAPTAELPTVTIEANENFLNIFCGQCHQKEDFSGQLHSSTRFGSHCKHASQSRCLRRIWRLLLRLHATHRGYSSTSRIHQSESHGTSSTCH